MGTSILVSYKTNVFSFATKIRQLPPMSEMGQPRPPQPGGGGRGEGEAGKAAEGAEAGEKEGEEFRGLLKLYLVQGRGAQGRGKEGDAAGDGERLKQPKGLWTLQIAEQESWV